MTYAELKPGDCLGLWLLIAIEFSNHIDKNRLAKMKWVHLESHIESSSIAIARGSILTHENIIAPRS